MPPAAALRQETRFREERVTLHCAMTKRSLIFGVLLALAPALSTAQADPFRAIDRSGDGSISSEEWYRQDVVPVPFTVVDLNGDETISESEFREWSSARGGASVKGLTTADRFRSLDRNKDGLISAEEWNEGWHSSTPFSSVDASKDGTISRQEFGAWDQRRIPAVAAPAELPGTTSPAQSERLRSSERGPPSLGAQRTAPPAAPALAPAPRAPVFAAPSTSPGVWPSERCRR